MAGERTVSVESKELLQKLGLVEFSFPQLDLQRRFLPGLKREIEWLREHVKEGRVEPGALVQEACTKYVDPRFCPQFLRPYVNDQILGGIIFWFRASGEITSGDPVPAVASEDSRFGLSIPEIGGLVIPEIQRSFSAGPLVLRLPTVAELLYMRYKLRIFPNFGANYAQQTREWTSTPFLSPGEGAIGNLFVSGAREEYKSSGVHWWTNQAGYSLPSLGFRLVAETREVAA